ncbi:PREDICTED: scale keratin-like [Merops nubicus]|uniref:scale keratin-like n=1 Tax=Merops nubicus TaxID=57421 RepID=UPI0004F0B6BB|nr:PREDICTED: scale keratin-like [Merops nubicus]
MSCYDLCPPKTSVAVPQPIAESCNELCARHLSAFGGSLGRGGLYGAGATQGSGGLCTFGRPYTSPACSPCAWPRYSKKLWDNCGPC